MNQGLLALLMVGAMGIPEPLIRRKSVTLDDLIGPDSSDDIIDDCVRSVENSAQVRQENSEIYFCCNFVERSQEELNTEGSAFDLRIKADDFEDYLREKGPTLHPKIRVVLARAAIQVVEAVKLLRE